MKSKDQNLFQNPEPGSDCCVISIWGVSKDNHNVAEKNYSEFFEDQEKRAGKLRADGAYIFPDLYLKPIPATEIQHSDFIFLFHCAKKAADGSWILTKTKKSPSFPISSLMKFKD
jgi:hypothetical protein